MVKNLPANAGAAGDAGLIPGWVRYPEEEMAPHSSILTWRIPWTEEPDGAESLDIEFTLVTRGKCRIKQCGDFGGTVLTMFSFSFAKYHTSTFSPFCL